MKPWRFKEKATSFLVNFFCWGIPVRRMTKALNDVVDFLGINAEWIDGGRLNGQSFTGWHNKNKESMKELRKADELLRQLKRCHPLGRTETEVDAISDVLQKFYVPKYKRIVMFLYCKIKS